MENSILLSTKKVLGVADSYTVFDQDIITHINATFNVLYQLGIGPAEGFMIEDATAVWEDFADVPMHQLNLVRTYVFLKVRMLFDPPGTSYLISAYNDQIKEYEWRLNTFREFDLDPVDPMNPPEGVSA
jgi:hypothetical protein